MRTNVGVGGTTLRPLVTAAIRRASRATRTWCSATVTSGFTRPSGTTCRSHPDPTRLPHGGRGSILTLAVASEGSQTKNINIRHFDDVHWSEHSGGVSQCQPFDKRENILQE